MSSRQIQEAPPVEAPAPIMEMARANCAERLRARSTPGDVAEAAKFEAGERDFAWAFKHEVRRLQTQGVQG